jgi:hypothetical protein
MRVEREAVELFHQLQLAPHHCNRSFVAPILIPALGRPSQLLRRARRTPHSIRRSCCWCDALHTRGTWRALMLPTEGPRVRGRASALLGVAGRRMGRHRLLLCGGFTYYVRWRRWGRSAMRIGGCVRG